MVREGYSGLGHGRFERVGVVAAETEAKRLSLKPWKEAVLGLLADLNGCGEHMRLRL